MLQRRLQPITLPEVYLTSLFTQSLFHGIYFMVFALTVYIIGIKRRRNGTQTRTMKVVLAMSTIMFLNSTIHLSLSFVQCRRAFVYQAHDTDEIDGVPPALTDNGSAIVVGQLLMEFINCCMGDSVIVWRLWVVWNRNNWMLVIPICLLIGSTTSSLIAAARLTQFPPGESLFSKEITPFTLTFAALTIANNLMCTALISGRIWYHNRRMRAILGESFTQSHTGLLILMVESGAIYSLTWITGLILYVCNSLGVIVAFDMISVTTGIVPNLIIILVALDITRTRTEQLPTLTTGTLTHSSRRSRRTGNAVDSTVSAAYPMQIVVSKNTDHNDMTTANDAFRNSKYV
ncbi:Cop9 signalosome complex subunit 1 [Mycena sanguinolenta]|uniref:Cop9 signalosome complex subunit 1 n=1 Tax=Mycena sanguinolenta TaxID=230812 RepID=A0A8H7D4P7_9AGAR|nr:Cop9 signalosome complex subunit 1 [Mycena sanguinolenta]